MTPHRRQPLGTGTQGSTGPSTATKAMQGQNQSIGHHKRATCQKTGISDVILSAMSERELQKYVVDGLKQRGYVVWTIPDMRRTTAGLPDVIAVHPDRAPLLMLELKTATGRVKRAQADAIKALQNIPGIYAAVVRPADWERLKEEV